MGSVGRGIPERERDLLKERGEVIGERRDPLPFEQSFLYTPQNPVRRQGTQVNGDEGLRPWEPDSWAPQFRPGYWGTFPAPWV